jgi:putative hydrolase of the HAD superfamily
MMRKPGPACLFIDLDDTLYPPRRGIWKEISRRINVFLTDRMGIPAAAVDAERRRLFETYGTTLKGLQHERIVDPQEYFAFVHDIPVNQYLAEDPELQDMLSRLPQKKYIFSNADSPYILRVLAALGVRDLFDGIVDIYATGFACKPLPAAYQAALRHAGQATPAACWLVDDLPRNLIPASQLGMTTVLVSPEPRPAGVDHRIDDIHALGGLLEADAV